MREVTRSQIKEAYALLDERNQGRLFGLFYRKSGPFPSDFMGWIVDQVNTDLNRHVAATFKFPWSDPPPKDPAGVASENTGRITYATPEEQLVIWNLEPGNPPRFVRVQS